ncbi:RICIN domain-containing protein [Amycolatopsis sp. cg13]|uniref:RICIN domain-containing protein n=1 Tax=Amycolatopsis sp. cg13 TaxID=3238807 RepID=UPI0035268E65
MLITHVAAATTALLFGVTTGISPAAPQGDFQIKSQLNNKCLDIAYANPADQANVQMFSCNGQANQHWYWDGMQIKSQLNNKCLDIAYANPADQANVQMFSCNGQANQHWYQE